MKVLAVTTAQVVAAVAATALVYFLLPSRAASSPSAVAEQLIRASGFTALIWAYLGLLIGLGASTRLARFTLFRRSASVTLHRQLNLVALALTVVHVASFVVAPGGSLLVALVPQTAELGAFGYTLGVLGFYLALLLGPSFYLRQWMGRWVWLLAHQFAALSYAAGLFVLRLSRPRRPADHLEAGFRQPRFATAQHVRFRFAVHTGVVAAAVIVLCVALVAIGEGQHPTR